MTSWTKSLLIISSDYTSATFLEIFRCLRFSFIISSLKQFLPSWLKTFKSAVSLSLTYSTLSPKASGWVDKRPEGLTDCLFVAAIASSRLPVSPKKPLLISDSYPNRLRWISLIISMILASFWFFLLFYFSSKLF